MTKNILRIPEGTEWPVIGRDPKTGSLILRLGFVTTVAEASGCTLYDDGSNRPLFTTDMLGALLVEWYRERREMSAPCLPDHGNGHPSGAERVPSPTTYSRGRSPISAQRMRPG